MSYVRCDACNGSGLRLGMIGEPDICGRCNGNTIVAVNRFVTQAEKTQWRKQRRAGKNIRQIAEEAGRHWNTIERHVSDHAEARQRAEGARARARRRARKDKS